MQTDGMSKHEVLAHLDALKQQDLPYERVLSSMCTYPHPIARAVHDKFIEANLGDPGLFPGTQKIEQELIKIMGTFFGDPSIHGYVSTGGTESNIQALRAMRNMSKIKNPNIIVSESAHFSFDKISDLLSVDIRKADLDSQFKVDMDSVREHIDGNTIGLVGIAGTTEFGQIDPISELSDLALDEGIFLHVDAAFGGFVIPFLEEHHEFDFSLPGVTSMTADPHKMGFSTIPAGGVLFREPDHLHILRTDTAYLTSETQHSLAGTRSGAAVAAAYAVIKHLGRSGYETIVRDCMRKSHLIVSRMREIGIEPLMEPVTNVVVLDVPAADDIRMRLREKGWQVSITRRPRALRLVIMPHLRDENIDLFMDDMENVTRDMGL